MREHFNYYRVSTLNGGQLDIIAVDKRRDSKEERSRRAWAKLWEDDRSPEYRMATRLIDQLGVEKTKEFFYAALVFEKENDLVS